MVINDHNNDVFTIRDEKEIDISEPKWNFIFNNSSLENYVMYFIGWHLDFIHSTEIKDNLNSLIINLSEQILIDNADHSKLIFKVKTLNRKDLNKLWQYYEYPSLVFIKTKLYEVKLVETFNNYSRKITLNKGFFHIYKMDPELNVLWIEKSRDINLFNL